MNILVIQTTESGVYFHRQFTPHYYWAESSEEHKKDYIAIVEHMHFDKIMPLVQQMHFDIVIYSVAFAVPNNMDNFIGFMKLRGSKIVLDVDDRYKGRTDVKRALRHADAVITVSDYLARFLFNNGLRKYPYIVENGIYGDERQFIDYPNANEQPVFGYLGSTRHEDDLLSMQYDFFRRKLFVVCEEYASLLNVDMYSKLKSYRDYAWEYNAIDVALAPLVPNPFNSSKSFLKVIEAGFKKKAIICTDTEPYNREIHKEFRGVIDLIPYGVSWEDRIESYTVEEARQRGEELYKLVQPFDLRELNKKRRAIYEEIIGDAVFRPVKLAPAPKQRGTNYTKPKKKRKK